jgi:MFS transporter, MHS family, proline/betaine transporter
MHPKPPSTFKVLFAGCLGSIVEWYNFTIFAYMATTITALFFPTMGETKGLILAFLLFAVGFLARPIGSLFFGIMGDRIGRQRTLLISQAMMAVPILLTTLLPTYQSIGFSAAIFLALFRFLQGVSVGGEQTTAIVYLGEMAPVKRRGLWVSVVPAATALGIALGALVVYSLSSLMSEAHFLEWGWRVCFFSGFLLALYGIWYRWSLPETESFKVAKKEHPKKRINEDMLKQIVYVIGFIVAQAYFYQLLYIWMPNVLNLVLGQSVSSPLLLNIIAMLVFAAFMFAGGYWIDQVGRRKVLVATSIIMLLLPSLYFANIAHLSLVLIVIGLMLTSCVFGVYVGAITTVYSEIFPAHMRVLALSLVFNIPFSIVGGLTPSYLTAAVEHIGTSAVVIAGTIFGLYSLWSSFKIKDMTGEKI